MLKEQHPLYKEKLYFDLVGMHWTPDKKCVFVAFHFHPFRTPSVHGFRPPSSFTKPRMLNAFVTWEDTLRGCGWCFLQTSTVRKTHLPSQFWGAVLVAKLGPNLGSMMNSIWHRKNDQLANVSQWKIGEYLEANHWLSFCSKMLHSQGTLFGLKKFHLAPPNFEGDESYGVSVAIFGPGCFTGNSKTNINVFVKQPDLCWTICTKGIDLATKRAQIQSCRIVSWSFQPLSRLAFVIRSQSLEGSPFSTISKSYNPQNKAKFSQNCQVPHLFSDLKKVCSNS